MEANSTLKFDQLLRDTLSISRTGEVESLAQQKTAGQGDEGVRTREGQLLREMAKNLRGFDIREVKNAGLATVLFEGAPSREQLAQDKTASVLESDFQWDVKNRGESLRKLAGSIRAASDKIHESAKVSGYRTVRGFAGLAQLNR